MKTKTTTLAPELLHQMDAYWRAASYLSVGQVFLYDNPLLKRPLTLADVKHMLLGHELPDAADVTASVQLIKALGAAGVFGIA
jgi:phosphoketolase